MLRSTALRADVVRDNYLKIRFDNGEVRYMDVATFMKGSWYSELADSVYFNRVQNDGFTVVWPDGQDLCPDDVYYPSTPDMIP